MKIYSNKNYNADIVFDTLIESIPIPIENLVILKREEIKYSNNKIFTYSSDTQSLLTLAKSIKTYNPNLLPIIIESSPLNLDLKQINTLSDTNIDVKLVIIRDDFVVPQHIHNKEYKEKVNLINQDIRSILSAFPSYLSRTLLNRKEHVINSIKSILKHKGFAILDIITDEIYLSSIYQSNFVFNDTSEYINYSYLDHLSAFDILSKDNNLPLGLLYKEEKDLFISEHEFTPITKRFTFKLEDSKLSGLIQRYKL